MNNAELLRHWITELRNGPETAPINPVGMGKAIKAMTPAQKATLANTHGQADMKALAASDPAFRYH